MSDADGMRVDQWLWAARFFKTRSLAQRALRGGKVDINGNRCKPSRAVRAGDRLRVTRGEAVFEIIVQALSVRRGPAEAAQQLYTETPESIERRLEAAEQRRLEHTADAAPDRRPDKRDRRRIRSFKQR